MDVTALFKAVLAPGQDPGTERFGGLKPGDGLTGKVVRIEVDGRLLIDLGRFRALAQTPIEALPGQVLHFKVESVGNPLHLRLDRSADAETAVQRPVPEMSPTGIFTPAESRRVVNAIARLMAQLTAADRVQGVTGRPTRLDSGPALPPTMFQKGGGDAHMAPAPGAADPTMGSLRPALVQMAALFSKPSLGSSVQQWVDTLRNHFAESGHLFETRLANILEKAPQPMDSATETVVKNILVRDMKPNLLLLKDLFSAPENRMPSATENIARELALLRQTVDRLLGHVEQQQERGLQRSSDGDSFQLFSHLIPVRENADPVRIKVYYPRKKPSGRGQGQHRVALLLALDRLGSVRADIFMAGSLLNVRFFVSDEGVKEIFDRHLEVVEKALTEHFQQIDVATFISSEKIARFDEEDLDPVPPGSVDVRI